VKNKLESNHSPPSCAGKRQVRWTEDRCVHELFLCLVQVKEKIVDNDGESLYISKYEKQAREIIYRIPIFRPSPPFVINASDLSQRVTNELQILRKETNEKTLFILLKEAAGKFFENLDFAYYHTSVKKLLRVRIEE
jgi:hypothetical protein